MNWSAWCLTTGWSARRSVPFRTTPPGKSLSACSLIQRRQRTGRPRRAAPGRWASPYLLAARSPLGPHSHAVSPSRGTRIAEPGPPSWAAGRIALLDLAADRDRRDVEQAGGTPMSQIVALMCSSVRNRAHGPSIRAARRTVTSDQSPRNPAYRRVSGTRTLQRNARRPLPARDPGPWCRGPTCLLRRRSRVRVPSLALRAANLRLTRAAAASRD